MSTENYSRISYAERDRETEEQTEHTAEPKADDNLDPKTGLPVTDKDSSAGAERTEFEAEDRYEAQLADPARQEPMEQAGCYLEYRLQMTRFGFPDSQEIWYEAGAAGITDHNQLAIHRDAFESERYDTRQRHAGILNRRESMDTEAWNTLAADAYSLEIALGTSWEGLDPKKQVIEFGRHQPEHQSYLEATTRLANLVGGAATLQELLDQAQCDPGVELNQDDFDELDRSLKDLAEIEELVQYLQEHAAVYQAAAALNHAVQPLLPPLEYRASAAIDPDNDDPAYPFRLDNLNQQLGIDLPALQGVIATAVAEGKLNEVEAIALQKTVDTLDFTLRRIRDYLTGTAPDYYEGREAQDYFDEVTEECESDTAAAGYFSTIANLQQLAAGIPDCDQAATAGSRKAEDNRRSAEGRERTIYQAPYR